MPGRRPPVKPLHVLKPEPPGGRTVPRWDAD
jgi:hypothetical protein